MTIKILVTKMWFEMEYARSVHKSGLNMNTFDIK